GLARLTSRTNADNRTVALAYDKLGRPTSKTQPGGAVWTWTYDEPSHGASIGQLTSHHFPAGSNTYSYDAAANVTSSTMCRGELCETMAFSYDTMARGRLDKTTYPDGEIVDNTYDTTGALSAVSGYTSAMVHDARGELTSITLANGTIETRS